MASMGAVDESTIVVTVVHDCQVSLFHGTFSVVQHRGNSNLSAHLTHLIG